MKTRNQPKVVLEEVLYGDDDSDGIWEELDEEPELDKKNDPDWRLTPMYKRRQERMVGNILVLPCKLYISLYNFLLKFK